MSDRERDSLTPEQELARRAVAQLPSPTASAGFREKLKAEFVSGTISQPRGTILPMPWYRSLKAPVLVLVAAAAVFIVALSLGNRGPAWRLQEPVPSGMLMVGGVEMAMDDPAINSSLKPGVEVGMEDTLAVTLMVPDHLYVQLTPSSQFTLSKPPGRWFGRTVEAAVGGGEIRISTGESFEGAKLMVKTDEVTVEVLGTTLAVIKEDYGTCVCVFEGSVRMGSGGGEMLTVDAGMRRTVFNDGRAPFLEEILPMERMKLQMLRESCSLPPPPPDSESP